MFRHMLYADSTWHTCYAGLKENAKAIELYQECINNAFGSAEAKYAQQCIEKLKPKEPSKSGSEISLYPSG